jgi:hypothetical protein
MAERESAIEEEEKKQSYESYRRPDREKTCHYSHDDFYVFDYVDKTKKSSVCHPSLCLSHA